MSKRLPTLIVLMAALFMSSCSSGPSKTVVKFYGALAQGDIDAATRRLSSTLVAQSGPKLLAGLAQQAKSIQDKGGIASVVVVSEEVGETNATVVVEVRFGNGSVQRESNNLIKENGKWKLTADK